MIPWKRVLLDKPLVAPVVKKVPACGTRRFVIMLHRNLSQVTVIQPICFHHISLRSVFNIIIVSIPRFSKWSLPLMVFGIFMHPLSPLCFSIAICLTLLDSITLIKFKTHYFYPSFTDIQEAALLCYFTSLRELFDTDKSLLCISIFYLEKEIEKGAAQISIAIQPQHLTISMPTHRTE